MTPPEDQTLLQKATKLFRLAGKAVALEAMKVWHVAQDPATPKETKALLYGALAYLVLPTDAVPDVLPLVGFTDDLAALGAALYAANAHITKEALQRAQASVEAFFG